MEKSEIKLIDVFSRASESPKCDQDIREILKEIIMFINLEQQFKTTKDINLLRELGIKLNKIQSDLKEKLSEVSNSKELNFLKNKNLKDNFYSLGSMAILHYGIYSQEIVEYLPSIKCNYYPYAKSIKDSFEFLYDECSIVQEVYNDNGIDGIARLVALNNKIYEKSGNNIIALINEETVKKELLLNLTSSESVLATYNSTVQAEKVLEGSVELNSSNKKGIISL